MSYYLKVKTEFKVKTELKVKTEPVDPLAFY